MINSFEVVTNRRIIYGENKIDEIAGILKWYGKKKVFFSTFSTSNALLPVWIMQGSNMSCTTK